MRPGKHFLTIGIIGLVLLQVVLSEDQQAEDECDKLGSPMSYFCNIKRQIFSYHKQIKQQILFNTKNLVSISRDTGISDDYSTEMSTTTDYYPTEMSTSNSETTADYYTEISTSESETTADYSTEMSTTNSETTADYSTEISTSESETTADFSTDISTTESQTTSADLTTPSTNVTETPVTSTVTTTTATVQPTPPSFVNDTYIIWNSDTNEPCISLRMKVFLRNATQPDKLQIHPEGVFGICNPLMQSNGPLEMSLRYDFGELRINYMIDASRKVYFIDRMEMFSTLNIFNGELFQSPLDGYYTCNLGQFKFKINIQGQRTELILAEIKSQAFHWGPQEAHCPEDAPTPDNASTHTVGIVIGVILACVVLISIVGFLIYRKRTGRPMMSIRSDDAQAIPYERL